MHHTSNSADILTASVEKKEHKKGKNHTIQSYQTLKFIKKHKLVKRPTKMK
jgi:hypothetical protein